MPKGAAQLDQQAYVRGLKAELLQACWPPPECLRQALAQCRIRALAKVLFMMFFGAPQRWIVNSQHR